MVFFAVKMQGSDSPQIDDGKDPHLELRRRIPTGRRELTDFLVAGPFGYRHDPAEEGEPYLEIVVPACTADSASDLASVPAWLGWIAAKTGPNLPAALVHDVLVVETDRDGELKKDSNGKVLTPVNHWWRKEGQSDFTKATTPYEPADRRRADRMFRDGMGDAGVDRIRRWLMWAAVAAVTLWGQRPKGAGGVVDATRVVILGILVAAGAVLLPYLLGDLADVAPVPTWFEGSWWVDFMEAGLIAAGLTVLACVVTGLWGAERHQWVLGLLVPAAVLLSWALAATILGGALLGLIRLIGRTHQVRYVGKIVNFYDRIGVAVVDIEGVGLEVGDRISVRGQTTSLENARVESMESDHRSVSHVVGGRIGVKVKMDPGQSFRKNDRVYLLERPSPRKDR